ncbi:MAG: sugar-binding protein [Thiotrichaceae bacterium]
MQKLTWLLIFLSYLLPNVHAETIPYGTPTLDGVINRESEWKLAGHLRMARFYGSDQFADFWLLWDENNLYVAGNLQDYTLFEDGGGPNGTVSETIHDDSMEIYIHPTAQPATALNEYSRVLAFTPTGKFQRLDRGIAPKDREPGPTVGLELPGNTGEN